MKKGLIILAIGLCVFLGGGVIWINRMQDKIGPQITFPEDTITYEEDNQEMLLEGVVAIDDEDGDVSDSIRINGIFPDTKEEKVKIVYIAKDRSNNISKATREVSSVAGAGLETAESVAEEPKTDEPEIDEEEIENPMAEASNVPEPSITPALGGGAPVVTLRESAVTISRGESIDRLSYVENITDDKDDRNALYRGIQITGEVDTATTGEYELIYYVVDSDGNRSNDAKLVVEVIEN